MAYVKQGLGKIRPLPQPARVVYRPGRDRMVRTVHQWGHRVFGCPGSACQVQCPTCS